MGRSTLTRRLQVNPDLRRVAGSATHAFLRSDPRLSFELTPDTFELLSQLREPQTIAELLSDPDDATLALIDELVELGILQAEGPRPAPKPTLRPLGQRLCGAPAWLGEPLRAGAVVIVGAPFDDLTPAPHPRGAASGPALVRRASAPFPLEPSLRTGAVIGLYDIDLGRNLMAGVDLLDAGDLPPLAGAPASDYLAALSAELQTLLSAGARPLLLGGDHSVSAAAIEALARARIAAGGGPLGIFHVDAHTDAAPIRWPGELHHGNVLRAIARRPEVVDITCVGARGFQDIPEELEGTPYRALSPNILRAADPSALAGLLREDIPYYVTVDIDALDPTVAPATGVLEPDGLGLGELRHLLRTMIGAREVLAADLCEVHGEGSGAELTGKAAFQIVVELIDLLARPTPAP